MSDMEAAKIKLTPITDAQWNIICAATVGMDAYELDDYLSSISVAFINGKFYKFKKEKLEPYGFTAVTKNTKKEIEIVALWYNGGAYWTEVVGMALKNE